MSNIRISPSCREYMCMYVHVYLYVCMCACTDFSWCFAVTQCEQPHSMFSPDQITEVTSYCFSLLICYFLLLDSNTWIKTSFEFSTLKKQLDRYWALGSCFSSTTVSRGSTGKSHPLSFNCSICPVFILLPCWKAKTLKTSHSSTTMQQTADNNRQQTFYWSPTLCQALG